MKSILQGWPQSHGGRKKQLYLLSCGSVFFIMFSLIFVWGIFSGANNLPGAGLLQRAGWLPDAGSPRGVSCDTATC